MKNLPFRVLLRESLFRVVDLELLAPKGDMTKLLGQFAALLIFASMLSALAAFGLGEVKGLLPQIALMLSWTGEHFLIATTMLVVGLFAVLSWDSTFPNRREVFVLAPLPIRARTLFFAKVAAVATALALTVASLHIVAGLIWPAALHSQATEQPTPALTYQEALPPVDAEGLKPLLDHDLTQARTAGSGALAPELAAGAVIGVVRRGVRRIYAYGTADPDSIFEIGSISKTFTGLLLAQLAVQHRLALREPVRQLLPFGTVVRPTAPEITLLDLAMHRSGLPNMPDNFKPGDRTNPFADYGAANLYAYLAKRGVGKRPNPSIEYSNLGFGLLGLALANRAGMSYPDLLTQEITGPLGLEDTVVELSVDQQARFIQGVSNRHRPIGGWDFRNSMAGAGAIRSTASDMLTYLEAQLHPDRLSTRADTAAGGSLPAAVVESQRLRADVAEGFRIALGWLNSTDNGTYWHGGGTGGHTSYAFFDPKADYAAIVLVNQGPGLSYFAGLLGEYVRQRLAGEPALLLENVVVPSSGGFPGLVRFYAAYWITMLAAGVFVFCCVLGVQGVAAQILSRRWFLQTSSFLQLVAFCLFVGWYMLQPMAVTPAALLSAQNHGLLYWSPSYWFLGFFQQLNGSPALAPLASRAWIGLAIGLSLTATVYLLAYFRTLRKIVEEPDIVATGRSPSWMPGFGLSLTSAVTQFSIRTLLRSRQHRMVLAFYWGIAFALVLFITKAPMVQEQLSTGDDLWHQPNVPLLVASVLILCAAIMGIRVVASMPLELRANWVFRIMPIQGGPKGLAAVRRAFYILGLVPAWAVSAVLFLSLWPWRPALGHLIVLGLLGIALTELSFLGFHKIPFTCSYLPGKSRANMAVLSFIALLFFIVKGAGIERRALENPASFITMVVVLGILAVLARWRASALARSSESDLRFEEEPDPAVSALDLHRDGAPPLG